MASANFDAIGGYSVSPNNDVIFNLTLSSNGTDDVSDAAAGGDDGASGADDDGDLPRRIFSATFLVIIIICSVIGNSLVCIAVLTRRNLRRSSNFFYVSLACSDLLVSTSVMTFAGVNDVKQYWMFGEVFCNIWISLDVMCCTASILNICAISFDRYLHIWKPYDYTRLMSPRRTILLIVGVWLLSALISFLPIQLGFHRQKPYDPWQNGKFECVIDFNPVYAATSSIISFFIPCAIMLILYANMYRLAQRHAKSIRKQRATFPGGGAKQSHKATDNKASITLGVIMGVFLVCWFPFFTVNVITPFVRTLPQTVFAIVTWLGYINSMANPIIYTIFNKEFRNAFKKLLGIEKCCGQYDSLCCKKDLNAIKNHKKKRTANGTSSSPKQTAVTNSHKNNTLDTNASPSASIPLMNMQNNNHSEPV